jgi:hypothetical protein
MEQMPKPKFDVSSHRVVDEIDRARAQEYDCSLSCFRAAPIPD